MRLKDQVAIVTGGAGGIGAGICRAFAEEGANVAIGVNQNTVSRIEHMSEADGQR